MEDKYMKGTPPLCAVSARDYIFKVNDANYIVEIPRKGTYSDVAPDVFEAIDGGFNIYDEESKILYLPSITKVLFAVGKYPKLDVNQLFVPYSIKTGDDIVTLVGQIITMVV
jgi:hypothetical protein